MAVWSDNVYYAQLNPLGGIASGGWQQTASYPSTGQGQSCVTSQDYIYCVGGDLLSENSGTSYYAQLSPTGGITGNWIQTTGYSEEFATCVTYNSIIYCIGGPADTTEDPDNDVYYAQLSSSGIGAWQFDGTFFGFNALYPDQVDNLGCATSGAYVYCVGGLINCNDNNPCSSLSNEETTNSVWYDQMSTTGGLEESWQQTTSLPQSLTGVSCFVLGGYLDCVGGQSSTLAFPLGNFPAYNDFSNGVYSAQILPSGGLGTWGSLAPFPQNTAYGDCGVLGTQAVCTTLGSGVYDITPVVQLQDQNSCSIAGGSWSGSTCTLSSNLYINNGATLEVTSGTTLDITGSGSIDNFGSLTVDSGGILTNLGEIISQGALTNAGTFTSSGTFYNWGQASTNTGTMTNSGTMYDGSGGAIEVLSNSGTLTNSGTMADSDSILTTTGSLINSGTLTLDSLSTLQITDINFQFGTLTNYGSIANSGSIVGYTGSIYEGCGAMITGNQPPTGSIQRLPCAPDITTASGVFITSSPVISGTENLQGGAPVAVDISYGCFQCNDYVASTTTDSSGGWSVAVPLPQGTFTLFAEAAPTADEYASGLSSPESNTITVTVDQSLDQTTCQSVIGGTWDSSSNTCTNTGEFTIGPADYLQIGSGATLVNSNEVVVQGGLTNFGTITNYQSLEIGSTGTLSDYGTMIQSNEFGTPTITDSGTFAIYLDADTCQSYPIGSAWNSGLDTCTVSSPLTIGPGYVLQVPAFTALFVTGTLDNSGTVHNSGTISTSCGGSISGNPINGNAVQASPCTPAITTPSGAQLTGSLSVSGTLASTDGNSFTITLYSGNTAIGTATTGSGGDWTVSASPSPGEYTLYVTATSAASIVSPPSNEITVTFQYLDQASCSSPLGGSWSAAQSQCSVGGSYALPSTDSLQIPAGAALLVSGDTGSFAIGGSVNDIGSVVNEGTLTVQASGTLSISGSLFNSGTLLVGAPVTFTVSASGSLTNTGQLTDNGILNSYGTFANQGGARITITPYLDYIAALDNYGTFTNGGSFDFEAGSNGLSNPGTLSNSGTMSFATSPLYTSGTFTNTGLVAFSFTGGAIPELSILAGTLYNYGTLQLFPIGILDIGQEGGFLVNEVGGVINNEFQFIVDNGGSLTNYGTITNSQSQYSVAIGAESFSGEVYVITTATNYGTIDNHFSIDNEGALTNNGAVVDSCGSSFSGNPVSGSGIVIQSCFRHHTGTSAMSGGGASSDQTSYTGVEVLISGSSAPDGTQISVNTADLTGPSTGVPSGLGSPSYFDVYIIGIGDGTAQVCITTTQPSSGLTMQYWDGSAWVSASDIAVTGSTVICGGIPVSALTGTNIALGTSTMTSTSSSTTPVPGVPEFPPGAVLAATALGLLVVALLRMSRGRRVPITA